MDAPADPPSTLPPPVAAPPRPDTDADGFHDDIDECPNIPEVRNGLEDEDGCPDTKPSPRASWPTTPEARPQPPPMVERCRDGSKIAGGITFLVVGAGNLVFGGVILFYSFMGPRGASSGSGPGTNDPLAFGIGAMAFGAALTASGIALTVIGSDKRPCSEIACAGSPVLSLRPMATGAALGFSF